MRGGCCPEPDLTGHAVQPVVRQVSRDELQVVGEDRYVEVAGVELGLDQILDRRNVLALLRVPAVAVEVRLKVVSAPGVEGDVRRLSEQLGGPGHVRSVPPVFRWR